MKRTQKSRSPLKPVQLAVSAVFSALVCVATIIFTVYVPQTRGFFNIGETMVYITALLFGPLVGGIAGGLGSMLADVILGYMEFAPATLVIKMCEGAVVGFLSRKTPRRESKKSWRAATSILGVAVGLLLAAIGSTYYCGNVEVYLGTSTDPAFTLWIPAEVWYLIGGLVAFLMVFAGVRLEPTLGWTVLSITVGGLIMVTGYFIYELFLVGPGAFAEIPVNIGQMSVGLIVSIPVVRAVWKYLPSLREQR